MILEFSNMAAGHLLGRLAVPPLAPFSLDHAG